VIRAGAFTLEPAPTKWLFALCRIRPIFDKVAVKNDEVENGSFATGFKLVSSSDRLRSNVGSKTCLLSPGP